ncbi:MAG TPA: hypothetical protein DD856_13900 [Sulfobacillus sp.]|nr:hypothetical protein [Sulfobacillus sp.]
MTELEKIQKTQRQKDSVVTRLIQEMLRSDAPVKRPVNMNYEEFIGQVKDQLKTGTLRRIL